MGVAVVLVACGAVKDRGELMVAMQTDLSLPKDIDHIEISVTSYGKTLWDNDYAVGPGGAKIPATLGVVGDPTNAAAPVEIKIIAKNEAKAGGDNANAFHVLRDVTTTVPADRTALLRMPIDWLCWNQVSADGTGAAQSTCPTGQTCVAGSCSDNAVNSDDLEPFDPSSVFGGSSDAAAGACLDTLSCFAQGSLATVDTTDCSIPAPASSGSGINVALLRENATGIADSTNGIGLCTTQACYVPLDEDPTEGWSQSGGKILLPAAVCRLLATATPAPAANVAINGIAVTTTCATKTPEIPTCGAWDSVGSSASNGTPTGDDGGTQNTSCLVGTWNQSQGSNSCNGETGEDAITISSDGNGGYLVNLSLGPFNGNAGTCDTLDDSSVPATANADGSITFTPSLSQVCTCSSAAVSVTLAVSSDCSTLTATQSFSGVAQCPQSSGGTSAPDASVPMPIDSGSAPEADGGGGSGDGPTEDAGGSTGNFCSTCGAVACTVTTTFQHPGTSIGEDGGSSPADASLPNQCGEQSCQTPDDTCCGTTCVDTLADPNNCGTCGHECSAGTCDNGICDTGGGTSDSGVLLCGPGNCSGCCEGTACVAGNAVNACGLNGVECVSCAAQGDATCNTVGSCTGAIGIDAGIDDAGK